MLELARRNSYVCGIAAAAMTAVLVLAGGCEQTGDSSDTAAATPVADSPKNASSPTTTPTKTRVADAQGEGAEITFEKTSHDFGNIWDIEEKTYRFQFTNTGDETLHINEDLKTSCGCTAAKPDKFVFEPGESGSIGITFKPKGHGRQAKTITVLSNATNTPSVTLVIQSDISQFVAVEPHILKFDDVKAGQRHSRVVTMTSVDPGFEIVGIQPRHPNISARLLEYDAGPQMQNSAQKGEPKLIEITLDETTPWGQVFGAVNVKTRGSLPSNSEVLDHDVNITVNATVYNNILLDVPYFQAGLVLPGDSFEKVIRLTSRDGQPFNITNVELLQATVPGTTIEAVPLDEPGVNGYELVLKGDSGEYLGSIRGSVKVETDMPGDETITIRVAGVVREQLPR